MAGRKRKNKSVERAKKGFWATTPTERIRRLNIIFKK